MHTLEVTPGNKPHKMPQNSHFIGVLNHLHVAQCCGFLGARWSKKNISVFICSFSKKYHFMWLCCLEFGLSDFPSVQWVGFPCVLPHHSEALCRNSLWTLHQCALATWERESSHIACGVGWFMVGWWLLAESKRKYSFYSSIVWHEVWIFYHFTKVSSAKLCFTSVISQPTTT